MTNKETAYKKVAELVERFTEQYTSYKKAEYNETLTRRDFIDPFFKALGWDIDNEQGNAEAYREVIHEDKIKVGKATKAPDYSFRLSGGKRLFFVEAKKPSVAVKDEILPAYQVRRYGWSAKLAVSIITDFEEFAIYDCTKRPAATDKASVARIKYLTYKEYLTEFDFIWNTFSKERVLKGSFDAFIKSDTHKKGTATVDKAFLESLDSWRTQLANNIALRNRELDEDEINFAVQQTLDRIIFLRIAEDRAIEPYAKLQSALKTAEHYKNLFTIFKEADDKYNSGLFDFKKDTISKNLVIDDKVIKAVINDLYYPISPYEFSVLSVEILGSAYEQFLGKQIKIDAAHRAKIEDKPEVRKAGGVYYTPQYVVDYIVQKTVGALVEGKSPKEVAKLKIVDPACGSGSFLLGAYQYLLDWHKDHYSNKGKTAKGRAELTPEGNLTSAVKKQILLNNIYGVDIDVNAVEVTKLSLLLKCMEGETPASIAHQLSMFSQRVLPTLDNNIKSGNSLIDTDYYDSVLDFGDEKKVKPFNWQRAFPEVFNRTKETKAHIAYPAQGINETQTLQEPLIIYNTEQQGGFDVVIGNPPYGAIFTDQEKRYLLEKYTAQNYQLDSYLVFLEQAFVKLLKKHGKFGMIIPNPWLTNLLQKNLRKFIFKSTSINEIVHFKSPVFPTVTVDTEIILITNSKPVKNKLNVTVVEKGNSLFKDKHSIINHRQDDWAASYGNTVNIFINDIEKNIFKRIQSDSQPLEKFFSINVGIKPYQTGKGKPKQTAKDVANRVYDSEKKDSALYRKYLRGSDINRYRTVPLQQRYIKYGEWLAEPRLSANFDAPVKIFMRQTSDRLIATLDIAKYLCLNNMHVLVPKETLEIDVKYFLGLINSILMNWYYQILNPEKGEALAEVKKGHVSVLPIKIANDSVQKQLIVQVDSLLQLNEELANTKLASKIEQIQQRIAHSEQKINEIVYKLYDLTPDEIKLIEESAK